MKPLSHFSSSLNRREAMIGGLATTALWSCSRPATSATQGRFWGTEYSPFGAHSPWNCRPLAPVFHGTARVPASQYFPKIESGALSTGVFVAGGRDAPVTIYPLPNESGVWDPHAELLREHLTLPRWPANVAPAKGGDGHAEVIDLVTGLIHSFWQLRYLNGRWCAKQHAWSPLGGRGFGDPRHYFQGARAAGVPSCGGLIRTHEVADGLASYQHALALSLDFSGLAKSPTYVFPATASDWDAQWANNGSIPMGSLLMLPPEFDEFTIAAEPLRKIAATLKRFGGYVVDRNVGTPFVVYAEIGAPISVHPPGGWNSRNANDLQRIRAALRCVVGAEGWLDGEGRAIDLKSTDAYDRLSMRGTWKRLTGSGSATFDGYRESLNVNSPNGLSLFAESKSDSFNRVHWGAPNMGQTYRLTVNASAGCSFRMILRPANSTRVVFDSGFLANGDSVLINWPDAKPASTLQVRAQNAAHGHVAPTLRLA